MCARVCVSGDLTDEEAVLEWLLNNKDATPQNDIIDLVDRGMLKMLLQDYAYVAVFFCRVSLSSTLCL